MNSKERHELRYKRRKERREKKFAHIREQCDNFDNVFTFEHLWKGYRKSILGVGWKTSTQKVKNKPITTLATLYIQLHKGTYKSKGFYCFTIIERGKERHIKSVHITERIVQSCLCYFSIIPLIAPTLIYDNSACIKGKGIDFAKDRLNCHLHRYYRHTGGNEGFALVMDFHSYFDLLRHDIIHEIILSRFTDERLIALYMHFVNMFGDIGLGLGSQISQITAVAYPNAIDKYIKSKQIESFGRYMDDSYLIDKNKTILCQRREEIFGLCAKFGIELNAKKTQIVKLSRGIKFLKQKFVLTTQGKVLRIPTKESERRMRKKLKTFSRWLDCGKMTIDNVTSSYYSWKSHLLRSDAHRRIKKMDRLFSLLINSKKGEN